MDSLTQPTCEVCGAMGRQAKACRFEKGCSCWRGVPCDAASHISKENKDAADRMNAALDAWEGGTRG